MAVDSIVGLPFLLSVSYPIDIVAIEKLPHVLGKLRLPGDEA